MPPISSPFPRVIFTRINGRRITRVVMRDWVIVRTIRPDYPNVIWVRWIARKAERGTLIGTPLIADETSRSAQDSKT